MPAFLGMPDRVAVPLLPGLRDSQAGSPAPETDGTGHPLVVTVKLKAAPV